MRRYQYDVTDELQEAETAVLVWRDKEDDVMYQTLDDFDALLLETLAETPTSLNGLQTMLAEFMPSENAWQDALRQKWTEWLEQGIFGCSINQGRLKRAQSISVKQKYY